MRGRYAALSILALAAGAAGGVFLERFYLNPANDACIRRSRHSLLGCPNGPQLSPTGSLANRRWGWIWFRFMPVRNRPATRPRCSYQPPKLTRSVCEPLLRASAKFRRRIETVGFVGYDEHLTSHVHTRVDGWIETLNVRAVGDQVNKGEVLFELFSPEFGVASFDFLRSLKNGNGLSLEAARNKLRSHGASELADCRD